MAIKVFISVARTLRRVPDVPDSRIRRAHRIDSTTLMGISMMHAPFNLFVVVAAEPHPDEIKCPLVAFCV